LHRSVNVDHIEIAEPHIALLVVLAIEAEFNLQLASYFWTWIPKLLKGVCLSASRLGLALQGPICGVVCSTLNIFWVEAEPAAEVASMLIYSNRSIGILGIQNFTLSNEMMINDTCIGDEVSFENHFGASSAWTVVN